MLGSNPFSNETYFSVTIDKPGVIKEITTDGKIKEIIKLEQAGTYEFSYDGNNSPDGMRFISVQTNDWKENLKLVQQGGSGGSQGLENISFQEVFNEFHGLKSAEQDTLRASGENITEADFVFWNTQTDINVGQKVVNQGPDLLVNNIDTIAEINKEVNINLNNYVYNDDQSKYISSDTANFTIDGNTIKFTTSTPGNYNTIIDIIDEEDENLRKELKVSVNVGTVADTIKPEFLINKINTSEDSTYILNLDESANDNLSTSNNIEWTIENGSFTTATIEGRTAIFTPDTNRYGLDYVNATITDEAGNKTSAQIELDYQSIPDVPIANNDLDQTQVNQPKTTNVLANDEDADEDIIPSQTKITRQANNGLANINEDGTITYTPNNDFIGLDDYEYEIIDSTGLTDTARVDMNVVEKLNTPPKFNQIPDGSTNEDIPVAGPSIDDYLNDEETSKENMNLAISISNPELLTASINANRQVEYTLKNNKYGSTNVTITATDEGGLQSTATYNFTVNPINDMPVLGDIPNVNFYEDETFIGDTISISDIEDLESQLSLTAESDNPNINVSINEENQPIYTTDKDQYGVANVTFKLTDTEGGIDQKVITVIANQKDDNPIANDDYISTAKNTSVSFNPADNDTDADKDLNTRSGYVITNPSKGIVSIDENGLFTYTPNTDAKGVDIIEYKILDNNNNSSNKGTINITIEDLQNPSIDLPNESIIQGSMMQRDADDYMSDPQDADENLEIYQIGTSQTQVIINQNTHVVTYQVSSSQTQAENVIIEVKDKDENTARDTITINPIINNAPVASNYSINTTKGAGEIIGPAFNVSDDHTSLANIESLVSGFSDVSVSIDPITKIPTITPNPEVSGTKTGIVTFTDEQGKYSNISMTVNIASTENNNPVIGEIASVVLNEDSQYTGPSIILSDIEDASQEIALVAQSNQANLQISLNANNEPTYTSTNDWDGTAIVTYTATDTDGGTATKNVNVTVNPVNDAVYKTGDIANIVLEVGQSTTIDLKPIFEDKEYTDLQLTHLLEGLNLGTYSISNAIATINAVSVGSESVRAKASDESTSEYSNYFTVTVNDKPNTAPIFNQIPDGSTNEDVPVAGPNIDDYLSDAQTSNENMNLAISISNPELLTASINANRQVEYTLKKDESGSTNVTITATDEGGLSKIVTYKFTVNPLNDAPTETSIIGNQNIDVNTYFEFNWESKTADVDNTYGELSPSIETLTNASYSVNGSNMRITPNNNYTGTINDIIVKIADLEGDYVNLTGFDLTITGTPNQKPVANNDAVSTNEDVSKIIYVLANDTDDKGLNPANVNVISAPAHGSTSVNTSDGSITYTPAADRNDNVSFQYEVADNEGLKDTASVNVTINPVDDAPRFTGTIANKTNLEDVILTFTTTNFNEVDGESMTYQILNLPSGWNQSWTGNQVSITAPEDYNGTISGLVVEAKDPQNNAVQSNAFSITKTPVNDPVYTTGNIANIVLDKGNSTQIDLKNYFEDKETTDANLIYTFAGLSLGSYTIANGILTINATTVGTESDLQANASDGETNANGNYFSLTVNDLAQTSTVTFDFRNAAKDTRLSSGTSTLQYRIPNGTWNTVTDTDGTIEVELIAGQTYEVEVDHTNRGGPYAFYALRRPGDNETFDQQDANDHYQEITAVAGTDEINAYIILNDFPMSEYIQHAGFDGSKKVHPNNEMTIWWNDNYTPSNADQRTWIADIQNQVATIPFITINLPFVESTTLPSGVVLKVKYNNTLGNATGVDANNYITGGRADYPTSSPPSQRVFKTEIYQAMTDWQDSGGSPPFFDTNGNIDTTGKDVMTISYLFKPSTLF